ncbi:ergosterol biosynthesis ERG4/ERG24 family protein [Colletotrichum navitas]|uniref:7-dehydrocholesterol reductase n=1 Tax=Colletotrichum navitas TaxID=681940 RepID=A0AAD8PP13_9PEZI|nr:ergosterol biosynthesis ERG4/ERG24 family protein [Colletotrichum navitas]KAK1573080.1 ergosterol biosynthesis ERG4/ERG24 family protein [Colletotrichum navitas]
MRIEEGPKVIQTSLRNTAAQKRHEKASFSGLPSDALQPSKGTTWGRSGSNRSWLRSFLSATPLWLGPLVAVSFEISLRHFNGSLAMVLTAYREQGILPVLYTYGPRWSLKTLMAYTCWIVLQAILYVGLPGPNHQGQQTPAGHLLTYRVNGLRAWILTYSLLSVLWVAGVIDVAVVAEDWSGWFVAMNLFGLLASAMAFVKAHVAPTHSGDRKFTGNAFLTTSGLDSTAYDFYMGIELNPRLGEDFDLKLFTNGRAGMMTWTLIDISNLALQHRNGTLSASLVLVTILHSIYIVDFFANESWYLRTIDITHDHYGFYLAWGCFTWLPAMYTLQAQYLGRYPTRPSPAYMAVTLSLGLLGYYIFRRVNAQKDLCRRTNGDCLIWGEPARFIIAPYRTSDGTLHKSLLLCNGWWGVSRHANYTGDLLLSFSMCAVVGTTTLLVWFYAIFMTGLLLHRCLRDEERCLAKYGSSWDEYCRRVPWRLIPGIW